ncbi:MAG: hypothetical protein HC897_03425 [Thermoanaerobaculia bacterium]|nr:hypothetical protein [Thermoanaerobaculia bacterium]
MPPPSCRRFAHVHQARATYRIGCLAPLRRRLEPGTFDVDAAGQATYNVPINVPPGLGGAQPKLAFAYGSRQRDGLLGVGWSLSGLSLITRTKATYAVDGFNGAIDYGPDDRLTLDGQRLVNISGGYGEPNTLYYTELQSWNHVRAGATPEEGFTVVTRGGDVHEYGQTADSRILVPGGSAVRVWALNATSDRNGNRVEYTYTLGPNPAEGAYYPDTIRYTVRSGMQASRLVQFTYEPRPDPIEGFAGGFAIGLSQRLKEVTITFDGNLVRKYVLAYRTSATTELSQIESITEIGSDGTTALPATTMEWSEVASPGFDISKKSILDQHLGKPNVVPMSVSGSGRTDLVQIWTDNQNQIHATAYLATAEGEDVSYTRSSDTTLGFFGSKFQILPCDLTGDGRTDLLVAFASGPTEILKLAAFLSNGEGFDDGGTFDTGDSWSSKHLSFFPMDVNGDGRTDLVEAYGRFDPNQGDLLTFRSYLSMFGDGPGKMFTQAIVSATNDPAQPTNVLSFWPMDVNGDGAMDLVRVWLRGSDSHVIVDSYVSVSTALDHASFEPAIESDLGTFALANQIAFMPVDVNADGIPDLLQVWKETTNSGITLHLSTFLGSGAGSFAVGPDSTFENQTINDFYVLDLDGGGSPALVSKWISGTNRLMFTAFRSSQAGVFRAAAPFDAGPAGSTVELAGFFAGDANGDGKGDLIRVRLDENQQVEIVPYLSSGPMPDLLTRITNPLGGAVDITYAPLTDPAVYQPTSDAFPSSTPVRQAAPIAPTQFPAEAVLGQALYVVAAWVEHNDPAKNRFDYDLTTTMFYTAAQIDLLGRGWQGFATVTQSNPKYGRSTRQSYLQNFPETFMLTAKDVFQGDLQVSSNTTAYTEFVRAQGVSGTPIYEVLQTSSRYEQFNTTTGAFDFALGQTYQYDDYGNLTDHAWLGYVDRTTGQPLDPAESVYRYASYLNVVRDDGWALGFVEYAKDSANATDGDVSRFLPGDYHLEHRTYTAELNVETQAKWDSANDDWLTTTLGYDVYGNQTSETKPGGATTITDFDPDWHTFKMRTTSPPDAQGRTVVTSYGYDPRFGLEAARQDSNGSITITSFDALGRKAIVQGPVPVGTQSDPNAVTPLVTGSAELRSAFQSAVCVTVETTGYFDDGAGGVYSEDALLQSFPTTSAREFVWNRSYLDGRTNERQTVRETGQSAGNAIVRTDYDAAGNVTLRTAPFFSTTTIVTDTPYATLATYDILKRPLTRTIPIGENGDGSSLTTWVYGSDGLVTMTEAAGSSTPYVQVLEHHFYDGQDKVRAVTLDPQGANATTTFAYDGLARLLGSTEPPTATSPNGISNTVAWDSLDRRTSLDNPDQNTTGDPNVQALSFVYDPSTGLLASQTDAAGETIFFTYDALERILGKRLPDGRTITFTYDDPAANGGGLLTAVEVSKAGTTESRYDYVYDPYGNAERVALTIEGEPTPFVTQTTFDPQKRMVAQTLPDGGTLGRTYAYAQLIAVTNGDARADYPLEAMVASEKPSRFTYGDGAVETRYAFSPLGQVFHETVSNAGGAVIDVGYAYDALQQLLSIGDKQSFGYLNRRLSAASISPFNATAYHYDASGNLTSKDGVDYTYQAHYPVTGTSGGQTVFSAQYDACGRTQTRTTGGRTLQFEYDGQGCLARVSDAGATLREMLYDAFGNRIRESDARRMVFYVNASYTVERPVGGAETVNRIAFDDRGAVAEVSVSAGNVAIRYFRRDHKGSNTHAFDAAGALVLEIAYAGYGFPQVVTGEDDGGPSYEQRTWDADLGLYYFGARYYDPVTGRYLTPDTEIGGKSYLVPDAMNRFAFELNNPINRIDTTGNVADWVLGLLFGIALIAIGAAIVLTGGAATVGMAVFTGALIGAGLNGAIYSVTHRDVSGGKFWAGWAVDATVGAVLGGVTAGLSAGCRRTARRRARRSLTSAVSPTTRWLRSW